jgi:hypothetical protein
MKKCKQCGEVKPSNQFRRYYGGRKGHYTRCLICEKVNSRYKYLVHKINRSDIEEGELQSIETLYTEQRTIGLEPPNTKKEAREPDVQTIIGGLLNKYKTVATVLIKSPAELQEWLVRDLTEEPEYYDRIYDDLKKRFRPLVSVGAGFTPVYDETHKEALEAILNRFCEYEDTYYK